MKNFIVNFVRSGNAVTLASIGTVTAFAATVHFSNGNILGGIVCSIFTCLFMGGSFVAMRIAKHTGKDE